MRGSWYCTTRAMLLILSEASLVHVGGGDGVVVVVDVVVVHLCVAPPTKKKEKVFRLFFEQIPDGKHLYHRCIFLGRHSVILP